MDKKYRGTKKIRMMPYYSIALWENPFFGIEQNNCYDMPM